MNILEGAEIEFESNNPLMAEFVSYSDKGISDKIGIYEICDYLGISDKNGDNETVVKIEKILDIIGKDNPLQKIESIVSEIGFKPGMLDDIYSKVMLDKEIKRQTTNLDNLLKHKYGNSNNIQGQTPS